MRVGDWIFSPWIGKKQAGLSRHFCSAWYWHTSQERNEIHPEDDRRCKIVFLHNYRITYVANPKQSTKLQKYVSLTRLQDTKSGYKINCISVSEQWAIRKWTKYRHSSTRKTIWGHIYKRCVRPNCWKTRVLGVQSPWFCLCWPQNIPSPWGARPCAHCAGCIPCSSSPFTFPSFRCFSCWLASSVFCVS